MVNVQAVCVCPIGYSCQAVPEVHLCWCLLRVGHLACGARIDQLEPNIISNIFLALPTGLYEGKDILPDGRP